VKHKQAITLTLIRKYIKSQHSGYKRHLTLVHKTLTYGCKMPHLAAILFI